MMQRSHGLGVCVCVSVSASVFVCCIRFTLKKTNIIVPMIVIVKMLLCLFRLLLWTVCGGSVTPQKIALARTHTTHVQNTFIRCIHLYIYTYNYIYMHICMQMYILLYHIFLVR